LRGPTPVSGSIDWGFVLDRGWNKGLKGFFGGESRVRRLDVNQFFKDKAENQAYLAQMNQAARDNDVSQLLIMVDHEGNLGDADDNKRKEAVENHYKWVDAAKVLGCHSIRVNAAGSGSAEEVGTAAIDGLGRLSEYAAKENINVIVENHGSYSSDGKWLAGSSMAAGSILHDLTDIKG